MRRYLWLVVDRQFRFSVLSKYGFYNWMSDDNYLKLAFRIKTGETLNLENPHGYNEKIQWLKLYYRNPILPKLVDKYEVRSFVSETVGDKYLIPLVGGPWSNVEDIDFEKLPNSFVIKCTHDSGGILVCRDKSSIGKAEVIAKLRKRLVHNFFWQGREWPYRHIQPRIIAEEYMTENTEAITSDGDQQLPINAKDLQRKHGLIDYKFMCFDGQVKALFMDIGVIGNNNSHAQEYYRNVYNADFELLPVIETRENYPHPILPPDNYQEMLAVAQKLSKGFPHVRVDLYSISDRIYVGELTFFHGSGFTNVFTPKKWDQIFGDWIKLPSIRKDEVI